MIFFKIQNFADESSGFREASEAGGAASQQREHTIFVRVTY